MIIWLSQLPKPQELTGYKKCPAVTYGGKPNFWVCVFGNTTEWVVWSRLAGQWKYQIEGRDLSAEITAVNWGLEKYFCLEPVSRSRASGRPLDFRHKQ